MARSPDVRPGAEQGAPGAEHARLLAEFRTLIDALRDHVQHRLTAPQDDGDAGTAALVRALSAATRTVIDLERRLPGADATGSEGSAHEDAVRRLDRRLARLAVRSAAAGHPADPAGG